MLSDSGVEAILGCALQLGGSQSSSDSFTEYRREGFVKLVVTKIKYIDQSDRGYASYLCLFRGISDWHTYETCPLTLK